MSLNSVEILCLMEESVVSSFDKYLLSQTKRSSQNYQLWLLLKRVARAKTKAVAPPALEIRDLAQKLQVSSSQVRNRLSDLIGFYQEHLAILHLRSTPYMSALLALERALETNDETYVNWAEKRVDRLVTESKVRNTYTFYDFLRFNRIIYEWHADKFNQVYTEKTSLLYHEFEEFTLIEKCKLYLDTKSITHDEDPVLKKIDAEITDLRESRRKNIGPDAFSFAENIYYHLYLIVKEENDFSYRFIFRKIEEVFKNFGARDAKFVLVVLTNRIGKEIMTGSNELQGDYLKLVTTLLDFPEIKITEWMLKNFVTILCRMQKPKFAEKVLNAYLSSLPNDRQHQCLCYNMAIIRMVRGELEEATALLRQITLSETTYYLGGRFVLFRAMYKAEDYEGVLSLTKSFKGYLRGLKTMDPNFKRSSFFFLKYFNALVRLSLDKRFTEALVFENRVKKLLDTVLATSAVVSRKWLIEEIEAHLQ